MSALLSELFDPSIGQLQPIKPPFLLAFRSGDKFVSTRETTLSDAARARVLGVLLLMSLNPHESLDIDPRDEAVLLLFRSRAQAPEPELVALDWGSTARTGCEATICSAGSSQRGEGAPERPAGGGGGPVMEVPGLLSKKNHLRFLLFQQENRS